MNKHYKEHSWSIIEEGFHPDMQESSESIFSLGNGRMGQRANFEEGYSGHSLLGNYVAGVYYPDKTRVGWWKNGYPEYFAKVLNAANWIGIAPVIGEEKLDLATAKVSDFKRELNMHEGYLHRSFVAELPDGHKIQVDAKRFLSMVDDEAAAIRYSVKSLNFTGEIKFQVYVDGDIINQDSNYEEKFWDEVSKSLHNHEAYLTLRTKKLDFQVCTAQRIEATKNGEALSFVSKQVEREKYVENVVSVRVEPQDEVVIYKFATNVSSENHPKAQLQERAKTVIHAASAKGFVQMLKEQKQAWTQRWTMNDIVIEGDVAAQQAIRFNIFQLNQTYTGEDPRLNIGPKGFTGEKYGGSTYWDTEAYCLPFYMLTTGQEVARNLLKYRYNQLQKAIENAEKLGFSEGAALYPMVTMNGEECHNEWEITFMEIHRNGAIAYAIYNYILHTGDEGYLKDGGLEVLLGIARFWSQRITWSAAKAQFVMLGVTGPNEYENNSNNNWYTNYIARWCLKYTLECIEQLQDKPGFWSAFTAKTAFTGADETDRWKDIIGNLYEPKLEGTKVYLQQDGFMDKEQRSAADLNPAERPINQHWSWDRILRSIFIKQADVLQGMYFFEDEFDEATIRENFDFYEPKTVHESSLSPCVHAILAARLGNEEKALEMYLRTARLDLDDYNHEADEGLHITSMAGTWMAVVEGFGGKRVRDGKLSFSPMLPSNWKSYRFNLVYRKVVISVEVNADEVVVDNRSNAPLDILIFAKDYSVEAQQTIKVPR
jgi:maltose phosphorylase